MFRVGIGHNPPNSCSRFTSYGGHHVRSMMRASMTRMYFTTFMVGNMLSGGEREYIVLRGSVLIIEIQGYTDDLLMC